MNNSVFEKTMENIRNRQRIRLLTDYKKLEKLINKVNFKSRTIFKENPVGVHILKNKIIYDKPIYIGLSVLDLSKYLMCDFHYNVLKKKYKEIQLCYKDRDSFIYNIQTEVIYKDINEMKSYFDTSDYSKDHYLFSNENKKVIGKFKDELNGNIILEYVGLKSKMYTYKYIVNDLVKGSKKDKGTKKHIVKNELKFEDCKDVIFNKESIKKEQNVIRSRRHEIYTEKPNKTALSWDDNKRPKLEDKISSIPYGHYKIPND